MSLMSYIHKLLLKRGKLDDLLPDSDDLGNDRADREAARADIEARAKNEKIVRLEVDAAVKKLKDLNKRNHYGESLRRAFGGS